MAKVMSGFRLLLEIIICVLLTEFVIGKPVSETDPVIPDDSFCEQFSELNKTFHIRRQQGSITTSKTTFGRDRRETQETYLQGTTLKECFVLLSQDDVQTGKLIEVLLCNEILNVAVRKCKEHPRLVTTHLENEGLTPCDAYMKILSYVQDDEFEMVYDPSKNELVKSVVLTRIKQPPAPYQMFECPVICSGPSAANMCHLAVELYLSPPKDFENPEAPPLPVDGGADDQNKVQPANPSAFPQPTNNEAERGQVVAPSSPKGTSEPNTQINSENEGGDDEIPEKNQKESGEKNKHQDGETPVIKDSGIDKGNATALSPLPVFPGGPPALVNKNPKPDIKNNSTMKNETLVQASNMTKPTDSTTTVRPTPALNPVPQNLPSQGDKSKTDISKNSGKEDPTNDPAKPVSGDKINSESQPDQPGPNIPPEPAAKTNPGSDSNKLPASVVNPAVKDTEDKEKNMPSVTEKPVTLVKTTVIPVTTKASPVVDPEAEKPEDVEMPPAKEDNNFLGAEDEQKEVLDSPKGDFINDSGDGRGEPFPEDVSASGPELGVDHKDVDENPPPELEDQSSSEIRVPNSGFPEQQDSHFFAYFLTVIIIIILGYLVVHNKQKILGLIVEGRGGQRRRTHNYRKLDTEGSKGSGMIF